MRFSAPLAIGFILVTGCSHFHSKERKFASSETHFVKFVDARNWEKWGRDFQFEADQFNAQLMELSEKLRSLGGKGKLVGVYNGRTYFYDRHSKSYEPSTNQRCRMTVETSQGGSLELHRIELTYDNRKTGQLQITTINDPDRQANMPDITVTNLQNGSFFSVRGSLAISEDPIVDFSLENKLLMQRRDSKHPAFELNLINGMPTDVRMSNRLGAESSDAPPIEKCVFDVFS